LTVPASPAGLQVWIIAIAEVAAGAFLAAAVGVGLRRFARREDRARWRAEGTILALLRLLLPWAAVIGGLWAAVLTLPLTARWWGDADHALVALTVLAVTLAASRIAADAVQASTRARAGVSASATIFVNIARVAVLAVGLLILLGSLGVSITPLLTALGVGGLAVALALQDTLSNLFAGIHILASGKMQPGDFIQLEGGQQGYVVDTNWRNTTIRELPDNLVIVPNATLASSIMTNYQRPEQEMTVKVPVGVGYDSDLDHVERVTCEVAREVMRSVEGGVPSYQPVVRYHAFGNSSIDFSVMLRTSEVTLQYAIVHEFIKRLHRRYREEGIEIPYPTVINLNTTLEPAGVSERATHPALTD
jgi:small-conductance mechanosensitive channel